MTRRALICGISGQDGAYLAQLLLEKGYEVCGTSRDAQLSSFGGLKALGIHDRVQLESMAPTDFRSVLQIVSRFPADEIYNLAGQSSVGLSFQQPAETLESNTLGTLNLLEAIRFTRRPVRLYNAASSECFGNTGEQPADEETPFRPRSPYAVAKAASFWTVANYRDAYGLWACSGILANHESPLRPLRFVTRKIVNAAVQIANGSGGKLVLGDLDVRRDWGWAPEYVGAMWQMLQHDTPIDLVISTGETNSLADFVESAFAAVDLDWRRYVSFDDALRRPSDIASVCTNPGRARAILGWSATSRMREVVHKLVDAERRTLRERVAE